MSDFGMKITVPGKDITSTDVEDYVVWSKYGVMTTVIAGTYNYTFPSDLDEVNIDISHSLGYRPLVWFSINGPNAEWKAWAWWAFWYNVGGNTALRSWTVSTLTSHISIRYREAVVDGSGYDPTSEAWTFKYYAFVQESHRI